MTATEELRARLDELGVEYDTYDLPNGEHGVSWIDGNSIEWEAVQQGENFEIHALQLVTPEQAIAATVGVTEEEADSRDLMDAIRNDDGVRYSMDEVMDIMGKDVAAKVGNAGYGIQFADWYEFPPDTMVGETVFDADGNAIGWIADATVGRSCASCPEMDNPDSYISHLQSALKWHDEHVPRPTNPRNTCVVLKGQNPPEEVLFVHDEGGVTHYLPEDAGTCNIEKTHGKSPIDGKEIIIYKCSECGTLIGADSRYCNQCGARVVSK